MSKNDRGRFGTLLEDLFDRPIRLDGNFVLRTNTSVDSNQQQTNDLFTEKWGKYESSGEKERLYEFHRKWYLSLYGFDSEQALGRFLRSRPVIFDAGCGLGFKTAWFAKLAPESVVFGMDFSDAARSAATTYADVPNLFFIQGDIAATGLRTGSIDYVNCDQVIMHTESPEATFSELARITKPAGGEVACYFYAKKALPRELVDDYFRNHCAAMERRDLWTMSEQLAELGKRLQALDVQFESPDIPALGIKGGTYSIQRFIYWNFLKCFWNEELGRETSVVTNFDWYGPSNARRFSKEEIREILSANGMIETYSHSEEACHSGRFAHRPEPSRQTMPQV